LGFEADKNREKKMLMSRWIFLSSNLDWIDGELGNSWVQQRDRTRIWYVAWRFTTCRQAMIEAVAQSVTW